MSETDLFRTRVALVQAFLRTHRYSGILLSRVNNYAMATGGKRNYVSMASDLGASSLFVTKDGEAYFVGNSVEETRQMGEELGALGCGAISFPWYKGTPADAVRQRFSGRLVSDDGSLGKNVDADLAYLRALLTPIELDKYRRLGALAAEAMCATLHAITPGMPEAYIAGRLVSEGAKRRCVVPVALVAADERIARFRHPLPTQGPLLTVGIEERAVHGYVMVVGGFVREGLAVSITRFKRVGNVPNGVRDAFNRICAVDALMQEATQPGKTLGDVFAACQKAYVEQGFPEEEWHNHHQGGSTGYAARTCKAFPACGFPTLQKGWADRVRKIAGIRTEFGQAFAWNPSAVGVKSEDTFILLPDGTKEIVTKTPSLPQVDISAILGRETGIVKSGIAE